MLPTLPSPLLPLFKLAKLILLPLAFLDLPLISKYAPFPLTRPIIKLQPIHLIQLDRSPNGRRLENGIAIVQPLGSASAVFPARLLRSRPR